MPTPIDRYRRRTHYVKMTWKLRQIEEWTNRRRVAAQAQVALFQQKVKSLLDQAGVYNDMHHQYMAYAHALDKSQAELDFLVDLIRERRILRDRFERRALDPSVLDQIDALVIYRTRDR